MLLIAMPLAVAIAFVVAIYLTGAGERRRLVFEIALLVSAFLAYFGVRAVTEGNTETSVANAEAIIEIQRTLGIFVELELNAAAADRPWLLTVMNWVYIWGHWPLIAVAALWLYRRQPAGYRLTRNAFLISGSMGLVFFALLPTAPPRLMDMEFVDTVTDFSSSYRLLQPPSVTNQYAAFPSLHFGWNLLIGIAIVRYARRRPVRVLGGLSPVAMLVATLFTANHYIIDVAAGGMVALVGLALASQLGSTEARHAREPASPLERAEAEPADDPGPARRHSSVGGGTPRGVADSASEDLREA